MKKDLLLILCLLLLVGCSREKISEVEPAPEPEPVAEEPAPTYVDDNPIKVGLYLNGKLMSEYDRRFTDGEDLASFDVYFTNDPDVGGSNTKYNFNRYYNNYQNIGNYKIGFYISFDTNSKHYEKVVLKPDVEFAVAPYIYIYLYDDIHQPDGAWYSHITMDEYNDNSVFSSIKLYMAEKMNEVTSPITIEVFTYDSDDDFDEAGYYRGVSKHILTVYNK